MQSSSEGVGELAAALAKAQTELSNPDKSLTGTIIGDRVGEVQSFRYAPLATGLEIVRKALGQQGIAILQSTSVDGDKRMLLLTTTLAHSSGQWVSSQWPVCRSDQPLPQHRMGAALTYARRYALFALVGIAGEDDLDAPDLIQTQAWGSASAGAARTGLNGAEQVRSAVREQHTPPSAEPSGGSDPRSQPAQDKLQVLVGQLAALTSQRDAVDWARGALPQKNLLSADDATTLDRAFAAKLEELQGQDPTTANAISQSMAQASSVGRPADGALAARAHSSKISPRRNLVRNRIDKSALHLGAPKRLRDRGHLRYVASQPCLVCGRQPSDAHHLRFAQIRGLGLKVSDEFTVPLCRTHHRDVHRTGNEAGWWDGLRIDALQTARSLWAQSRATPQQSR